MNGRAKGGLQLVQGRRGQSVPAVGLREGSTGRVVTTLPRLWAVGEVVKEPSHVSEARHGAPGLEAGVELAFYRKYTEAMLRRYLRFSMSSGKVPSLMGKEMFRGHVSSYRVHGFDDAVNFCLDMEKQIGALELVDRELIKRIAVQEYTQGEAAAMLGLSLRHCIRLYGRALDRLTEKLLATRLMEPLKTCQGG